LSCIAVYIIPLRTTGSAFKQIYHQTHKKREVGNNVLFSKALDISSPNYLP
jgi:hypothetical protein